MKRFISVALLLIVAFDCGARIPRKKIQSPKAAEQDAAAGKPMVKSTQLPVPTRLSSGLSIPMPTQSVVGINTNRVFHKTFSWGYDTNWLPSVSTFVLFMGQNPGDYNFQTNTGTDLSFEFYQTNWSESGIRHFWTVAAADTNGDLSDFSNEVHFPPYAADHILLTWTMNWDVVTIYSSTNLYLPCEQWEQIAVVVGDTYYITTIDFNVPARFFTIDKRDTLTIKQFNPTP